MGSPASADKHDYQRCTDDNCPRFPCQVYKQGDAAGCQRGHARGHAEGVELGYKLGFSDGIAACPRPHGKG
jgi:hypothetical protein